MVALVSNVRNTVMLCLQRGAQEKVFATADGSRSLLRRWQELSVSFPPQGPQQSVPEVSAIL